MPEKKKAYTIQSDFSHLYKVDISGCWLWRGRLQIPDGYGMLDINGKGKYAHRIIYYQHKGIIPKGMTLDHLCRIRHCVNPEHLEIVTNRENIRRRKNIKCTFKIRTELLDLYAHGFTQTELSRLYKISQAHISKILRGLYNVP